MKHPPALKLLSFVQLFERFSFYGMRVLLLLYLVDRLHFDDARAYSLYAVYMASIELFSLGGALLADHFLGSRRTVFLGCIILAAGHALLNLSSTFMLGLSFLIVGCGLFTPNVRNLLGACYKDKEDLRTRGFTLFYICTNIGGVASTLLVALVGKTYGWEVGFGLAALGMAVGGLALVIGNPHLKGIGEGKKTLTFSLVLVGVASVFAFVMMLTYAESCLPLFPFLCIAGLAYVAYRSQNRTFLALLCLYVLFFTLEEQMCSTCLLFLERHVYLGPALIIVNPLGIVLLGPFIKAPKDRFLAFSLAFALTSFAFLLMGFFGSYSLATIGGFLLIAIAEILAIPGLLAYATKTSTTIMTSGLMLGHSLALTLSGFLSKQFALTKEQLEHFTKEESLAFYETGFVLLGCVSLIIALICKKDYILTKLNPLSDFF